MQKARRHGHKPAPTACRRTGSGSISLPYTGYFSPFPHGTCALSVSRECLALADGPARFKRSFTCSALLRIPQTKCLNMGTGLSPSMAGLSRPAPLIRQNEYVAVLQPRQRLNAIGLGYSPVARRYWGNHYCFLFLRVLRCFSSPRSLPQKGMTGIRPAGLSHSDISGSKAICTSPELFAAYHVLHRLREPRHPPYALISFSL